MARSGPIWITWESQRRNREIARALAMPLYEWSHVDRLRPRIFKYVVGIAKTLRLLLRERPRLVICQNPSIVLSAGLVAVKLMCGLHVFVDAHNVGLFPAGGRSRLLMLVSRWVQRHADMTIVTNDGLKAKVEATGGRSFVLPDPIPAAPETSIQRLKGSTNVLLICTYADDEPYEVVFEAFRALGPETVLYVTGNPEKLGGRKLRLPENVILTGFLPEEDYWSALRAVDVAIDLTTRDDCLVCGAYEAAAVGTPMVLSDTAALRAFFDRGAIFSAHSPEALSAAVREATSRGEQLRRDLGPWRDRRNAEWEVLRSRLRREIDARLG